MFETTSNISVNQNNSENLPKKQQTFTLPNIHKKKIISQSRTESQLDLIQQKQQLTLPNIFNNDQQKNPYSPTKSDDIVDSFIDFQTLKEKNKGKFGRDVRQKLGLVLGQIPQIPQSKQNEQQYSQDSDFQAKIIKNRQLIKQHRLRREQQNKSGENKNKIKEQNPKKLNKMRNQSLYEKRVKDYRNQSIENKYLQKRKQIISDKQRQKQKLIQFIKQNYNQKSLENSPYKDPKSKNQYNSIKKQKYSNDKNYKIELNKSQSKKNNSVPISYKQKSKSINNVSKTVTLFDGIQNFLQNPRNQLKEGGKPLVGLTLLKVKRDIEDKIKNINQKLGVIQVDQTPRKIQLKSLQMGATTLNWQRIQIKGEKVDCHPSNFEKQLERVSSLQDRSSICLQKFLQHQQILLQLQFRKKQQPRAIHTNSH